VTAPAAKDLMSEIDRFPTNPPTEAELTASKDALVQSLPGEFETTAAAAGAMQSIFLYDRPLNYYAELPAKYRAVTAEDVAHVAKEDLHPNALVIVAAGDRAKIEPGLKDVGLGTVEVRDIDGKPVTDTK
jgi:zinc protease